MFDNLIETKKKKERTLGGTIISVVIHAIAIGAAVYGTLTARARGRQAGTPAHRAGAASASGCRSASTSRRRTAGR